MNLRTLVNVERGARLLLAAAVLGVLGCSPAVEEPPSPAEPSPGSAGGAELPEEALARAQAASKALAGELRAKLLQELEAGGPAAAVRVCSEVAPEIAAAHSVEGLEVRRVSLKVRNPADRPDAYERAALERLAALQAGGELPAHVAEVVGEGETRELRYLEPLTIHPLCLQCHGDPAGFEPGVREILEELYPADEAVGYAQGDLRGAVSVRVALAP